jgi:hypothetical protein
MSGGRSIVGFLVFVAAVVVVVGLPLVWFTRIVRPWTVGQPRIQCVTSANNSAEAFLIKQRLQNAGIRVYLKSPMSGQALYSDPYPFPYKNVDVAYNIIDVWVREKDVDRARNLLNL